MAARTVRRTASTPRRCPSERGSPRSLAQRPLPSMLMATCRGTCAPVCQTDRLFCSFIDQASSPACRRLRYASAPPFALAGATPRPSYLFDLGFLAGQRLVDLLDELIGQILHLARILVVIGLAHLSILVETLQELHALAAYVPHRYPGMLGIFVGNLDEFLTPLRGQGGNG